MSFDKSEISMVIRLRIAIKRYEEEKAKGSYDYLLSRDAKLFLAVMKQAGYSISQIECASKTDQNKVILSTIIDFFVEKGYVSKEDMQ